MVKFKGPYDKMIEKPFTIEQQDKVSLVEKCPDMSIRKLLEIMPEQCIGIYPGYDDEVDEKEILSSDFAYEDDSCDAADVFEENSRLQEQLEIEKAIQMKESDNKKESAGDVLEQQSQADTTLPPKAE